MRNDNRDKPDGKERTLDRLYFIRDLARIVTEHKTVAHQVLLDRRNRPADARIRR